MTLADAIPQGEMGVWVVGFVLTAIVSVLGFLVRNAFDGVSEGLKGLNVKLDAMGVVIAQHDGDRRVLEARLHSLERTVERLEREMGDLSEGAK